MGHEGREPESTGASSSEERSTKAHGPVPVGHAEPTVRAIRGVRVILDADLAALYGVEPRVLNRAVRRNARRFPEDFAFQLSVQEAGNAVAPSTTCHDKRRRKRVLPFVYTERGAIMAAFVLDTQEAVEMSVFIARAFVRLRSIHASHIELTRRLDELDIRLGAGAKEIRSIVQAVRSLMFSESPPRALIGLATLERWSGHEREEED
jgi:hypothetical protein